MYVLNMKLKPTKTQVIVFAAVAVIVAVICIACMIKQQSKAPASATCDEVGEYSLRAESIAEQCDFAKQFGLTVDAENSQSVEITVPSDFSEVYEEYNELQNKIGLDLRGYKGKTVDMVTYPLENCDEKLVLLVYKGAVIGGHITNGEYGEENKPLI